MKILSFFSLSLLLFIAFSCQEKKQQTTSTDTQQVISENKEIAYKKRGKTIAKASFDALSTQLKSALQAGGTSSAIAVCKVSAYPIIAELAKTHHAKIRRTSLKVRNPKDAPTAVELRILQQYEKDFTASKPLKPIVEELDNKNMAFYAPITLKKACLQCHGIMEKTLTSETYKSIKKLYPKDEAIGYEAGDLRGIWSIEFLN